MGQNITEVMTSNPCTIDADKSVAYAAKMMRDEDVGLAPIVEGKKLVGMLTDRDIATRVAAQGRDPEQVKVREVASKKLVTIDPQQDLDEALRIMAKHQIRRLPVVEEDGRLVGVVAQADIARKGDDAKTGRLVEEISDSGGQMSSIEGQFQSQFERRPEGLQEPQVVGEQEEPREEESISRVRAASSRGRRRTTRRASTTRSRSTARRKTTGTRRKKSTARKSTARKSTTTRKRTTKKRTTARRAPSRAAAAKGGRKTARKRTTKKRTTARRAPSRAAAAKGGRKTARKRATKKRTTARRTTGTRKRTTTRRKTTTTRRKSTARKSTARKTTRKRSTTVRAAGAKGGRKTARKRTTRRRTSR
jgi:CBS domain-containing protein